jgi:hypothetical protein
MVAGTPVVTTAVGAESMGTPTSDTDQRAWCGAIAEDAHSIAEAAVELHDCKQSWERSQQRGFEILASEFDANQLAPCLVERVRQCMEDVTVRRRRNFVGATLRHHHHRATEFMARWIQAKNGG